MKKFLNIIVAVVIAFSFSACEKDDICASTTQTTPRLVISFFDRDNPDVEKSLSRLSAKAVGEAEPIVFFPDNLIGNERFQTSANTISLPLRLTGTETVYELTQNSDNATIANTDTITINYTTNQIYVSRACGYKTNFRLNGENPVTRPINDTNEWINNLIVETTNIETENETHVKIYF